MEEPLRGPSPGVKYYNNNNNNNNNRPTTDVTGHRGASQHQYGVGIHARRELAPGGPYTARVLSYGVREPAAASNEPLRKIKHLGLLQTHTSPPGFGNGPIIERLTLSGAEVCVDELNMLGRATKSLTHMQGRIKERAVTNLGSGRGAPATPTTRNAEPRLQKYFVQLMAAGWKAKSGLPWEDTVDLDPPVSCTVAMDVNERELLLLPHWNRLAGVGGTPDPAPRTVPDTGTALPTAPGTGPGPRQACRFHTGALRRTCRAGPQSGALIAPHSTNGLHHLCLQPSQQAWQAEPAFRCSLPIGYQMWMVTEYCDGGSGATLMEPTAPGGYKRSSRFLHAPINNTLPLTKTPPITKTSTIGWNAIKSGGAEEANEAGDELEDGETTEAIGITYHQALPITKAFPINLAKTPLYAVKSDGEEAASEAKGEGQSESEPKEGKASGRVTRRIQDGLAHRAGSTPSCSRSSLLRRGRFPAPRCANQDASPLMTNWLTEKQLSAGLTFGVRTQAELGSALFCGQL
ncbi:hypothetical protein DL768_001497 [Monosporascus sp. mg162]|nr:hypothetical protein DL768_001497 [Monosporascus sp. mg162]